MPMSIALPAGAPAVHGSGTAGVSPAVYEAVRSRLPDQWAGATAFSAALAAQLEPAGAAPVARVPARTVTLGEMVALESRRAHLPTTSVQMSTAAPSTAAPSTAAPAAPAAAVKATAGSGGQVVAAAERYLGVPYRWGGTDPASGLDCSGFVQRALADLGVSVPRVSKDQSRAGVAVGSLAEARPGDLVYWNGHGGRPNHIGIYVGNGQMIHAPRTGDVVRYAPVRSAPPDAIRRVA